MYNSLVRLQNTFGFFTTVAFVVGALIALSDLAVVREPSAVVKANNIQVYVSCHHCPPLSIVSWKVFRWRHHQTLGPRLA